MADPVDRTPKLGRGTTTNFGQFVGRLVALLARYAVRINDSLQKDGREPMLAPLKLSTYTTATLPSASAWEGAIIYVSDGAAGSKYQGSDGISWLSLG